MLPASIRKVNRQNDVDLLNLERHYRGLEVEAGGDLPP
jgi:hypothetical protein